jgi:putative hydrolase of the HAD superfamily
MIAVLAFDADDTLWHTETLFAETQARLATILDRYAPHGEVMERLQRTERRNILLFGYGIKGFILSMVETAIEISGHRVNAAEIHEILMMGKAMLDAPLTLLDGVDSVLDELAADYRLLLITKGDMLDQQNKIEKSGLASRFSYVEVVTEKAPAIYQRIFAAQGVQPAEAVMIGNSIPSDVLPVLEIGAHAVHIPYVVTAEFERHDQLPRHDRFFQLASIGELPALIRGLNRRGDPTCLGA